jgi:hypothetical protein
MGTLTELAREGEAALGRFRVGFADPSAIAFFNGLAHRMRGTPPPYASEKITGMLGWAEILFSARKHERYTRGTMQGVVIVRQFLLQDLQAIRDIDADYLSHLSRRGV